MIQQTSWNEVDRLRQGLRGGIISPTLRSKSTDGKIKRIWESLPPRGSLTFDDFVKTIVYILVSPLVEHLFVQLQMPEVNEGDNFRNLLSKISYSKVRQKLFFLYFH